MLPIRQSVCLRVRSNSTLTLSSLCACACASVSGARKICERANVHCRRGREMGYSTHSLAFGWTYFARLLAVGCTAAAAAAAAVAQAAATAAVARQKNSKEEKAASLSLSLCGRFCTSIRKVPRMPTDCAANGSDPDTPPRVCRDHNTYQPYPPTTLLRTTLACGLS